MKPPADAGAVHVDGVLNRDSCEAVGIGSQFRVEFLGEVFVIDGDQSRADHLAKFTFVGSIDFFAGGVHLIRGKFS